MAGIPNLNDQCDDILVMLFGNVSILAGADSRSWPAGCGPTK